MKYKLLLLLFCLQLSAGFAQMRILKAANGKAIDIKELSQELRRYDVIFVGEFHDNPIIHQFQRDLVPLMVDRKCKQGLSKYPAFKWLCFFKKDRSRDLVLSFEMWERDTQDVMNAFLRDEISETEFITLSRAWGNYDPDYRGLISFAKTNKLPVVAANVPRAYAGRTAREGWDFVKDLPDTEAELIARELTAPDDAYKDAFYATMSGFGHAMDESNLQRLYHAQCMKDDTMAESIVIALDYYKNSRIIHFNGDFHSREFLGTVSRLQNALPKLKIAVISPVAIKNWQTAELSNEIKRSGTYILMLEPTDEEEKR